MRTGLKPMLLAFALMSTSALQELTTVMKMLPVSTGKFINNRYNPFTDKKLFLNHCKSGGSFSCSCNTGFFGITGTVGSCGDLDECLSSWNECPDSAECTNTVGSYECACGEGRIRNIMATF